MRHIMAALIAVAMLFVGANSYAVTLWGRVTNEQKVAIPYANIIISDPNAGPQAEATANSDGYWFWDKPGGYCGYKNVTATGADYQNLTKKVYDGSPGDCPPVCPDTNGDGFPDQCRPLTSSIVVNFTLRVGTSDIDADGVYDSDDNCPTVANGPKLGTCTSGSNRGKTCNRQFPNQCGCGAQPYPCDMFQSDADGNGVGDVCDGVTVASEEDLMAIHSQSINTNWLAAWSIFMYNHNIGSYDSFVDMLIGIFNGPDVLCSTCYTHDFDGDGIGDEFEDHGLPEGLTWDDYYAGFISAIRCCMEKWNQ